MKSFINQMQLLSLFKMGLAWLSLCSIGLSLQSQTTNLTCIVDVSKPGATVAPICRGQQIEEFNHQFQGGLYAQLINNPSFDELKNPIAEWSLIRHGSSVGNLYVQTSGETTMLNSRQKHCAKLEVSSVASGSVGMANGGYWGIKLENNTKYKVSFWARKGPNFSGILKAKLESNDGTVYAQSPDFKPTTDWKHFTCVLKTKGISGVKGTNRFVIYASSTGDVYVDVVTVMPPTWKNRPNGLRIDLAEKLDALKFKYIMFPGGTAAESASMDSCWNWKNSIGPLEQRPGSTFNRWDYKNDLYFGLDEYFQLCEDLGAEPVYVTSAGISENPATKRWWGLCPLDKLREIRVRDPFILTDQTTSNYYLYAQCGNRLRNDNLGTGVEVYRSKDLSNWTNPHQVFERPTANFWGGKEVWAPEVHRMGDTYFMFVSFPGRQGGRGTQILKAQHPEGPFVVAGEGANTPPEQRALDGTPWVDVGGTNWMIYCHEWCQIGEGTVRAVRMAKDWTTRQGESILLFKASEAPWVREYSKNKYVTDGPCLYRMKDGKLLILWSSFRKGGDYALGLAEAESGRIEGPWRQSGEPLFPDNGGHGMFFRDFSGNLCLVSHQPNQSPNERVKFRKLKEVDGRLIMEK